MIGLRFPLYFVLLFLNSVLNIFWSYGLDHHHQNFILYILQLIWDDSHRATNTLVFEVIQKLENASDTTDYYFYVKVMKKIFLASGKFLEEKDIDDIYYHPL